MFRFVSDLSSSSNIIKFTDYEKEIYNTANGGIPNQPCNDHCTE